MLRTMAHRGCWRVDQQRAPSMPPCRVFAEEGSPHYSFTPQTTRLTDMYGSVMGT